MKKIILILSLMIGSSITMYSQCPTIMPAGTLCITQAAGNIARDNAIEIPLLKEKIAVLESALEQKDISIKEIRETATKNETALREQNTKLLTDIATKTGQLITYEKIFVRDSATLEYLVKTARGKQNGLINIKLGSN